ncbi:hypothetical protein [Mycobacterium aquaticum]|nr:hypothetical protein [Mycobacterium aquaticum]
MPPWHKHQRFGIVIQEPLGHAGASMLMHAAMVAHFTDLFQNTWDDIELSDEELHDPSYRGIYPEVYAFHVGRRFGTLSTMDFVPEYKDILVEANPERVMHEINRCGVTVLAIPEGVEKDYKFNWPEERAFRWKTEKVFSYSPTGQVADPDITIKSLDEMVEVNVDGVIDTMTRVAPFRAFNEDRTRVEAEGFVLVGRDLDSNKRFLAEVDARYYEVTDEERALATAAREAIRTNGRSTETYRRRDTNYALRRLVP